MQLRSAHNYQPARALAAARRRAVSSPKLSDDDAAELTFEAFECLIRRQRLP